jgi:hypothetical protein
MTKNNGWTQFRCLDGHEIRTHFFSWLALFPWCGSKLVKKLVFMTVVTQLYLVKPWKQLHVSAPNWVCHHQVENKKNNRENHTMQHVTYIMFGRGERGTRYRFYNALGCVRLCRGDMDAYAICSLGRCLFRRYDVLCVEGVCGLGAHKPRTSSEDTFYTQDVIPTEETTTEAANSIAVHVTST